MVGDPSLSDLHAYPVASVPSNNLRSTYRSHTSTFTSSSLQLSPSTLSSPPPPKSTSLLSNKSIQGGAAAEVVFHEFWDSYLKRDCQYVFNGITTTLYPIPTEKVLGDQSNPEHQKFQYRFRLPQRPRVIVERMFLSGPDLRGVKLGEHVKQIDERNLRFEGDMTQGD